MIWVTCHTPIHPVVCGVSVYKQNLGQGNPPCMGHQDEVEAHLSPNLSKWRRSPIGGCGWWGQSWNSVEGDEGVWSLSLITTKTG